MKFGCNRLSSFRGEVVWTDDGRTTEPAYTISSPGAFGSGELKIHKIKTSSINWKLLVMTRGAFDLPESET